MAIATTAPDLTVTLHWPLSDEQFAHLCAINYPAASYGVSDGKNLAL